MYEQSFVLPANHTAQALAFVPYETDLRTYYREDQNDTIKVISRSYHYDVAFDYRIDLFQPTQSDAHSEAGE